MADQQISKKNLLNLCQITVNDSMQAVEWEVLEHVFILSMHVNLSALFFQYYHFIHFFYKEKIPVLQMATMHYI